MSDRYVQTSRGIELRVKVIPKASRSELVGWEGQCLKIRLAAVPEKGKANEELIKLLAKHFGIAKSCITLLTGESARQKKVLIIGATLEQIQVCLPI